MATKRRRDHDPLSPEAVELVAARFRILGEPIRIRLLEALQQVDRNVTELVEHVGSTQPNVSKHLRIMQEAGIVGRRQSGNQVYYYIADPTVFTLCDTVCASIRVRAEEQSKIVQAMRRRG